jgi:glycosyltransferase involved in cell wall biosynthesis
MTGKAPRRSVGIVLTHPIQYFAPLFRRLATELELTVYYGHRPTAEEQGGGFGVAFQWDVDLTSGYHHVWLKNRSVHPNMATFRGCDTPELGERLLEARHDVVLVAGWHAMMYWQAMISCWRANVPLIVRGDSQLVGPRSPIRRALKEALYPLFIRRFDACVSVGSRSEAYFQHYGAHATFRSPHFVDNQFFAERVSAVDSGAIRARYGISDDSMVVLFAGKMTDQKRPMDLVRAVAMLNDSPIHILFAGDGELRRQLEVAVAEAGLHATFAGFLNQTRMPDAYAAADVLVLPSDGRETWGLVVNEAMACGVPALVSRACGCSPDLVEHGVTGYTFECGDVRALAGHLRALVGSRNNVPAMGAAARDHVAKFNVDAAAEGVCRAVDAAVLRTSGTRQ